MSKVYRNGSIDDATPSEQSAIQNIGGGVRADLS